MKCLQKTASSCFGGRGKWRFLAVLTGLFVVLLSFQVSALLSSEVPDGATLHFRLFNSTTGLGVVAVNQTFTINAYETPVSSGILWNVSVVTSTDASGSGEILASVLKNKPLAYYFTVKRNGTDEPTSRANLTSDYYSLFCSLAANASFADNSSRTSLADNATYASSVNCKDIFQGGGTDSNFCEDSGAPAYDDSGVVANMTWFILNDSLNWANWTKQFAFNNNISSVNDTLWEQCTAYTDSVVALFPNPAVNDSLGFNNDSKQSGNISLLLARENATNATFLTGDNFNRTRMINATFFYGSGQYLSGISTGGNATNASWAWNASYCSAWNWNDGVNRPTIPNPAMNDTTLFLNVSTIWGNVSWLNLINPAVNDSLAFNNDSKLAGNLSLLPNTATNDSAGFNNDSKAAGNITEIKLNITGLRDMNNTWRNNQFEMCIGTVNGTQGTNFTAKDNFSGLMFLSGNSFINISCNTWGCIFNGTNHTSGGATDTDDQTLIYTAATDEITISEGNTIDITEVDTDTNAGTVCDGTTTYLDGGGECDDISGVYWDACADAYACGWIDSSGFDTLFHAEVPLCVAGEKITSNDGETLVCAADLTGGEGSNQFENAIVGVGGTQGSNYTALRNDSFLNLSNGDGHMNISCGTFGCIINSSDQNTGGSPGGNPFNQSLNTTDDVIFNKVFSQYFQSNNSINESTNYLFPSIFQASLVVHVGSGDSLYQSHYGAYGGTADFGSSYVIDDAGDGSYYMAQGGDVRLKSGSIDMHNSASEDYTNYSVFNTGLIDIRVGEIDKSSQILGASLVMSPITYDDEVGFTYSNITLTGGTNGSVILVGDYVTANGGNVCTDTNGLCSSGVEIDPQWSDNETAIKNQITNLTGVNSTLWTQCTAFTTTANGSIFQTWITDWRVNVLSFTNGNNSNFTQVNSTLWQQCTAFATTANGSLIGYIDTHIMANISNLTGVESRVNRSMNSTLETRLLTLNGSVYPYVIEMANANYTNLTAVESKLNRSINSTLETRLATLNSSITSSAVWRNSSVYPYVIEMANGNYTNFTVVESKLNRSLNSTFEARLTVLNSSATSTTNSLILLNNNSVTIGVSNWLQGVATMFHARAGLNVTGNVNITGDLILDAGTAKYLATPDTLNGSLNINTTGAIKTTTNVTARFMSVTNMSDITAITFSNGLRFIVNGSGVCLGC